MLSKPSRRELFKVGTAATTGIIFSGCSFSSSGYSKAHQPNPVYSKTNRPNIIFIMADDLGFGDIGWFGNPIVETENIDRLAFEGQTLTQHYSAAPVCMPSRVGFFYGIYPYRTGGRMSKDGKESSLNFTCFPSLLREAGYSTCVAGKWHVGNFPEGVKKIGFDEYYICAPGGWCDFWDYTTRTHYGEYPSEGKYSTDMITDESIGFIERNKEKPFFLFAAYTAPHFPLQAPDEDIEPFKNKGLPEGTEIVYGMIRRMDTGIGKIVEKLKSEGIYDNTMIVFTSDNGPRFGPWQGLDQKRFNWNLAGQKGLILDGGVKVPTIIRWPMDMKFNNPTYPYLMHGVDWYPTLCNIARADMPDDLDIDGIDFTQYLLGKSAPPSELKRFWTYNKVRPTYKSNSAMRQGGWKLHRPSIAEFDRWDQPAYLAFPDTIPDYQLFNIYSDPFEANDLSAQYPEKKAKMVEEFEAWYKRIMNEHDEINSQR